MLHKMFMELAFLKEGQKHRVFFALFVIIEVTSGKLNQWQVSSLRQCLMVMGTSVRGSQPGLSKER